MDLNAWRILMEGITPDGTGCTTVSPIFGGGYAIEAETGLLLYSFMRRWQPRYVLETGTHWGMSSACMALGLKDNTTLYPRMESGRLVTIDTDGYDGKPEALWKRLGLTNIHHIIASSEDAETYKSKIHPLVRFEWVQLDADHAAEAIMREFESCLHLISRQRCIIGFHDTSLDDRMHAGVKRIYERLLTMKADKDGWSEVSWFPLRNMRGLDLILIQNREVGFHGSRAEL